MTALNNLTEQVSDHGRTLADHGARITNVEKDSRSNSDKLDRLLYWILGVFAASAGSLLMQALKH